MISMKSKFTTPDVASLANLIIDLVVSDHRLLPPLVEVTRNCKDGERRKIMTLLDSLPDYLAIKRDQLRCSLVDYFEAPSELSVADKRGYLVEELYSRFTPALVVGRHLTLERTVYFETLDGREVCGPKDADIGWNSDCICLMECKVTQSTFLTHSGDISREAHEKLEYLQCIKSTCELFKLNLVLMMGTFDTSIEESQALLQAHGKGYEQIELYDQFNCWRALLEDMVLRVHQ